MHEWYDNLNTTVIPIEIKDGKIYLRSGKGLPQIKDGAKAEIIIPSFYIEDKNLKNEYNKEELFPLFKKGTKLFVEMLIRKYEEIEEEYKYFVPNNSVYCKIEIELLQDLIIKDRGTKLPRLEKCDVIASKIKITNSKDNVQVNLKANSLNEMYSKLSVIFEHHRTSHTGNVFEKIYFKKDDVFEKIKNKGFK